MAGEQAANLKKLLEIYNDRLKMLKELKKISDKIKEEIESKGEEAADAVDTLTQEREVLIEKIKASEMAARYNETLLSDTHKKIIKDIKSAVKNNSEPVFEKEWAKILFKIMTEHKSVTRDIKNADEKNAEAIKALMEDIKSKLISVKENKKMMDKFADDFSVSPVGTLMKEKK